MISSHVLNFSSLSCFPFILRRDITAHLRPRPFPVTLIPLPKPFTDTSHFNTIHAICHSPFLLADVMAMLMRRPPSPRSQTLPPLCFIQIICSPPNALPESVLWALVIYNSWSIRQDPKPLPNLKHTRDVLTLLQRADLATDNSMSLGFYSKKVTPIYSSIYKVSGKKIKRQ